jgi:hypothetical protein
MESERVLRIKVSAEELRALLGIEGEIISFNTPSRQDSDSIQERYLLIVVRVVEGE